MLGRQKVPVKELEQAVGKVMAKGMQLVKEKVLALARVQEKGRVLAKGKGRALGKEKERVLVKDQGRVLVKAWERGQGRVKAKASVVVAAAPAPIAAVHAPIAAVHAPITAVHVPITPVSLVGLARTFVKAIGLAPGLTVVRGTSVDEAADVARVSVTVVDMVAAVAQAWRHAFSAAFHGTAHLRFVYRYVMCIYYRARIFMKLSSLYAIRWSGDAKQRH